MLGSKKGKRSVRRLQTSEIRAALLDGRVWTGVGLVYTDDEGSHYEVDGDIGVLVHVKLMPNEEPLLCRLGGLGNGGTEGIWRIPSPGTEVIVVIPGGELEADPAIVAVLASGDVPSELDEDTVVIKGPRVVVLADDEAILGQTTGAEPAIKGTAYRTAEDVLFAALVTALGTIAGATVPSTAAAATTFGTAVTTFTNAASTYLATKAKVG